ncbi:MAG: Calx-beta domain-containing protein, partial [Planctomycetota bacterium]
MSLRLPPAFPDSDDRAMSTLRHAAIFLAAPLFLLVPGCSSSDSDPLPNPGATVSFAASTSELDESGGTLDVTVTLSTAEALNSDLGVVVTATDGTAANGSDYTAPESTLTFPSGSVGGATRAFTITLIDDGEYESSESIQVTLSGVTNGAIGATASHVASITNDDATVLVAGESHASLLEISSGDLRRNVGDLALRGLNSEVTGMAYDPNTNTLYAIGDDGFLARVDAVTGDLTLVGCTGLTELRAEAMAFDRNTSTLYTVETTLDQLVILDTETAAVTFVGSLGFDDVSGMAFDPATDTLYAVDDATDVLLTIDTSTGAGTGIGALGNSFPYGLTWDEGSSTLYLGTTTEFYTVDTTTGAATLVGGLGTGFRNVYGLAFDPNSDVLHGAMVSSNRGLVTIDAGTGAATLVNRMGVADPTAAAYDADSGTLYMLDDDALVRINTETSASRLVGVLTGANDDIESLAYDRAGGVLFGADTATRDLVSIDPSTATITVIGDTGFGDIYSMAHDDNTGTLYAVDTDGPVVLMTLNKLTGASSTVANLAREIEGLAYDSTTDTLFGIDEDQDLVIVDT